MPGSQKTTQLNGKQRAKGFAARCYATSCASWPFGSNSGRGAVGAPHSHPHIQCSVVESGVFDITIAGKVTRLKAGDSFLVPPDAVHGAVAVEAGVLVDVFTPMRDDFVKD